MRALSCFSGIGCFDYGVQNAGWEIAGQIEIDEFCQNALKKHWPNVWKERDIKNVTGELIRERCGSIDVIFGGPPCQPASVAGSRRGADDERWLWPEFLRLVSEIRPLWMLAENPRGVFSLNIEERKFPVWLADRLHALGYSLLPIELAAEDVGAPHQRERVWFVAYRNGDGQQQPEGSECHERRWIEDGSISVAIIESNGWGERRPESERIKRGPDAPKFRDAVADPNSEPRPAITGSSGESAGNTATEVSCPEEGGREERRSSLHDDARTTDIEMGDSRFARSQEHSRIRRNDGAQFTPTLGGSWRWPARPGEEQFDWEEPRVTTKSALGAYVNGNARNVARWRRCALQGIGNAVVPQCAQIIAEMINRFMEKKRPRYSGG